MSQLKEYYEKVFVKDGLPEQGGDYATEQGLMHFDYSAKEFVKIHTKFKEVHFPLYWLRPIPAEADPSHCPTCNSKVTVMGKEGETRWFVPAEAVERK